MNKTYTNKSRIFENLFVLELANNHLGDLNRGIRIINEHSRVVRFNNCKAAIKLQLRNTESFIHKSYNGRNDIRYIKKTRDTALDFTSYRILVDHITRRSCIPMATPFDEDSVDTCCSLGLPLLKIASSDVNDWVLIERIANTRLPTIISTGGVSEKDLDDAVSYFTKRDIPLAINHCVSLYPTEDEDLCLNQIDYLANRYPDHIIGFSTHEYGDWKDSMLISYAKGARTWERHIDILDDGAEVSKYCSLPFQCDIWFKAFKKAQMLCGAYSNSRRYISNAEKSYLNTLVRGVYAKRDIPIGYTFAANSFIKDFYLAIPLHKGQLSCREIITGAELKKAIKAHEMLTLSHMDPLDTVVKSFDSIVSGRGI